MLHYIVYSWCNHFTPASSRLMSLETAYWGCPQGCAFKSRFNMSREDFKKKLSHCWDQKRNSASNSQTCTNTMSSWKRKDLSQTCSSSDSDSSRMISFTVFDRTPFFEIIESSIFVKFCKNVCFFIFYVQSNFDFIESNFDFPSFFRVNFFVHLSLWKFMLNFQGGENLVLTFLLSKIKIFSFHSLLIIFSRF